MAYRLKSGNLTGKALREASIEQTSRALEVLSKETVLPQDVHEARKSVKRVRALLKLLEPQLPSGVFRGRYKGIGKAGDYLAGARDRHVLDTTLEKLQLRFGKDFSRVAEPIRAMLDAETHPAEPSSRLAQIDLDHAKRVFSHEALKLAKLKVDGKGFGLIAAGIEETYGAAKKNFRIAFRDPSDDRLHEFRKTVQWHWRHMALISRCWPEYFALRVAACRELAEALGDDHDLSVMMQVVHRHPDKAIRKGAEKAVKVRQKELRKRAHAIAERLFAETPRAFGARMARYWAATGKLAVDVNDAVGSDD